MKVGAFTKRVLTKNLLHCKRYSESLIKPKCEQNVPYSIHYSHLGQAMNPFINAVGQIHPLISILETSLLGSSENDAGPGSGTATPAQWDVRTSTLLEIRRFSFIIDALWKTSYNTRQYSESSKPCFGSSFGQ